MFYKQLYFHCNHIATGQIVILFWKVRLEATTLYTIIKFFWTVFVLVESINV